MPVAAGDVRNALHIREVVRITGLRREQLYMWQRRYNFPAPLRDGFGDRVYPPEQVARLKLIKQLLSEGWRAGAVVPLTESVLQSMLGLTVEDPAPLPGEIEGAVKLLAQHRIGELQNHLSKLLAGQGMRKFLEATLIPLNEAVHERVVRGEMENLPGAALRRSGAPPAARRDAARPPYPRRAARAARHAAQRSEPARPRDPGIAAVHRRRQLPDAGRRRAGAGNRRRGLAYKTSLVVLLFDRGISGKIAGQEIRSLRAELPSEIPLVVSGRAVNLLAKPIVDVQTAADFSSIMATMRELGITAAPASPALQAVPLPVSMLGMLPESPARA